MLDFSNTPLYEVQHQLQNKLHNLQNHKVVAFLVTNPDITSSTYNGNTITRNNQTYIYRGFKTWLDLAHTLACKMLTPQIHNDFLVCIRYEKLSHDSFHAINADVEEKYGEGSVFSTIHKNEESSYLYAYTQALHNVNLPQRTEILNLGVNHADEFELIEALYQEEFSKLHLVGVDYCHSAITHATQKFAHANNVTFYTHDITQLSTLNLPKSDLIISIGTLQSSNFEFKKLLMDLVQNQLKKGGAMILAFPNCRWRDGEMIYGAKMRNYPFSEMSNLYKDVVFCKKYFQQKKFRVTITGKDYIFITATSIRS